MIRRSGVRGIGRFVLVGACCLGGWISVAAAGASPALACTIAPGTATCAPDNDAVSGHATVVDKKSGTIMTSPSGIVANWTEYVFRDPVMDPTGQNGNMFCANCLDWLVQVTSTNASTAQIERVTVSDFSGWSIDLGVDSNTATGPSQLQTNGTISPNNVERSNGSGGILGWDFNSSVFNAGKTSVWLEAETNSTAFQPGTISVQDGVAGSDTADAPALPEAWVPGLGVAGGGVVGLFALRRRRRQPQPTP
ncbi:MAG: hypothetical protein JOY80_03645 [Candidatus Dormibacteraeota bacterium]|nr:hypothetical protein [Candidatus Dormibacteraeota bacterium]